MGCLRISAAPDIYEPKRCMLTFRTYDLNQKDAGFTVMREKGENKYTVRVVSSCPTPSWDQFPKAFALNLSKRRSINCRSKCTLIHAQRGDDLANIKTEFEEEFRHSVEDNAASRNEDGSLGTTSGELVELRANRYKKSIAGKKSEKKILNRVDLMNKVAVRKSAKPLSVKKLGPSKYIRHNGGFEAVLSTITPDSSTKQCNLVLKFLQKRSDERALHFFDWMKSNGKLKNNADAYKFALRALTGKEDWAGADSLLQETAAACECGLDCEAFNRVFYVCAKRRSVVWGAKWFRFMLQNRVRPNVSTIGILMNLYQKTSNLSEAEFVFNCMRSCSIGCVNAYSAIATIYTRLGLYDKSEEIIRLMDGDGVLPNLENWLVRLNVYSQQGKLSEAESVLKSMSEAGFAPNIVAYNTLITGYGRASNTKAAEETFRRLKAAGLEPDETTYRSMVEGVGRSDNYNETLCYYEQLKCAGFEPNSSNFHTMLNIQARHGDESGVIQTLKDMKRAGCQCSSMLGSLLQAFRKAERIEFVPSVLHNSFYEDVLLDPTASSILVVAYVQKSLLEKALQVLKNKKWEDSKYEENLYHLLICSFKEQNQHENAIKCYHQMPKFAQCHNLQIACTMIDIYCASNNFSDAENLYLKLKDSQISFDMIAYSVVLRMYIKSGSLTKACSVLDSMEKETDIAPDTFLFRDMLRLYQRCGMPEKSAATYYWILRSGAAWDEAMYNCAINCCGRALPVDEVSRLFDEMLQSGFSGNTTTFNAVLDVFGKAGLLKKARSVFVMARRRGVADAITYNTLVAAYGRSKDFESMASVVRRMEVSGFLASLEAFNCLLDAYGKAGLVEEFDGVLRKMKRAGCASDHYTYNIMMNIYGRKGWIEEVSRVMAELKTRGLGPDLYSYNTLIKAYGVAGMVEEAVGVLREMRARGFEPDRVTYVNLISAFQRNENLLEAIKWSLWMKQMGMQKQQ